MNELGLASEPADHCLAPTCGLGLEAAANARPVDVYANEPFRSERGTRQWQRKTCVLLDEPPSSRLEVTMETQDNDQVRAQVRTAYAEVAQGADGCSVGCCGTKGSGGSGSLAMGYTEQDLASVP